MRVFKGAGSFLDILSWLSYTLLRHEKYAKTLQTTKRLANLMGFCVSYEAALKSGFSLLVSVR